MAGCASCGRGVGDNADFCEYCGARVNSLHPDSVSSKVTQGTPADYRICPQCHFENKAGGAFCAACAAGMPAATLATGFAAAGAGAHPPTGSRVRRRWPVAVAGLIAAAAIVVSVVLAHDGGTPSRAALSQTSDGATAVPGGKADKAQVTAACGLPGEVPALREAVLESRPGAKDEIADQEGRPRPRRYRES